MIQKVTNLNLTIAATASDTINHSTINYHTQRCSQLSVIVVLLFSLSISLSLPHCSFNFNFDWVVELETIGRQCGEATVELSISCALAMKQRLWVNAYATVLDSIHNWKTLQRRLIRSYAGTLILPHRRWSISNTTMVACSDSNRVNNKHGIAPCEMDEKKKNK